MTAHTEHAPRGALVTALGGGSTPEEAGGSESSCRMSVPVGERACAPLDLPCLRSECPAVSVGGRDSESKRHNERTERGWRL